MYANHDYFMQQALDLAKNGSSNVAPNPMVGCVIVKDNEIIASGYHERFGKAHAEVNAIRNLPIGVNTADCILYVTLEPCSHFGKTPPCAELVIEKGFKTVVVACKDPNPKVCGLGIEKMRAAGIEVTVGISEQEARYLNKKFISFYENKRPYYILKWAQTADGYISKIRQSAEQRDKISGQEADKMVHALRAGVMGIMVGKNTVLKDNSYLTTRLVEGKNPVRIFIDKDLEVPLTFNIYSDEAPTLVFNRCKDETDKNISFIKLDFSLPLLDQISEKLYALNIQDVLVEGGKFLLDDFINSQLWDEAYIFQNPDLVFNEGIKAPQFALKNSFELVGNDKFYHHFKNEALAANGALEKEIF